MKRSLGVIALVLTIGAVVILCLPTFEMRWAVDPAVGGEHVTRHSWFDPLLLGYGSFHGPLTFLAGAVAVIKLAFDVRVGVPSMLTAWLLLGGAAVPLLGTMLLGGLGWPSVLAPVGLALAGLVVIVWHRRAAAALPPGDDDVRPSP